MTLILPESIFNRISFFEGLSPEQREAATSGSEVKNLLANQILFEQKEPATHFAIILQGVLKILKTTPSHEKDSLLTFVTPGEIVGALLMLDPTGCYPVDVISVSQSKILLIPREIYLKQWINNGHLMSKVQECVRQRCGVFQDDRCLQNLPLKKRVVSFLLRNLTSTKESQKKTCEMMPISSKLRSPKIDFVDAISFKLTRKDIAMAVGSDIASVIRIMSQFEKRGILETDNGVIKILKIQDLAFELEDKNGP